MRAIYITDASLPTRTGALPTYWDHKVALIELINFLL